MAVKALKKRQQVKALRHLDPKGANVPVGDLGVVVQEDGYFAPDEGPLVEWLSGGTCNVYEGDVEVVK